MTTSNDQQNGPRPAPTRDANGPKTGDASATGGDGALEAETDDQLLIDGQEEVFSRAEVELGRIEHQVSAGGTRLRPV